VSAARGAPDFPPAAAPGDAEVERLGLLASVFVWACIVLVTAVFPFIMFPVFLVSLPFDRTGAWSHWVGARWGRTIVRLVPGWHVRVEGTERLRRGPFVIIANHQSQVDILVTFFLDHHFKWLSKRSVFNIPGLGWMMWMCRYIPVVRGDKRSAIRCLDTSADWIRRGVSVIFFPEGTRSPDGRLQPFKGGAFRVAAQTGAPVLPVLILGTRACLPRDSLRFGRHGSFRVVIGEPIPSTGASAARADEFAVRAYARFQAFRDEVESAATAAS
jgi:1-acyl-sn-glycerol-3-phosphate acyltransferase